MSEETKKESAAKLKAWADHDKAKAEREMAFNDLESACTDMEGEHHTFPNGLFLFTAGLFYNK